ncbi:MAG: YSC84-related protein [Planctomycetota bacterium]|jgi:lipid-binding SYLF domain-containing protein
MRKLGIVAVIVGVASLLVAGCGSTRPEEQTKRDTLNRETEAAITAFKAADKGLTKWFEEAYGYVVFPTVGKGGAGVGGAFGRGQIYEQGKMIGYATLSQATIGLQLGGQSYSEVIFLKDKSALNTFKYGNYEVSAQASAVAAQSGASSDAAYSGGVAIFTVAKGGLMAEASVGGQKFKYSPK